MKTEDLLMYNLKHDLPLVNTYDNRYAEVGLRQLEENDDQDACMYYELATRYRQGIGGAPKSPEKAYKYYQKVLLSQRNVRAMYWLGELCLFNLPGKEQESLLCLKTAESLGDRDAAFLLGYIAFERGDIAPTDAKKAYALFQRAKKAGRIHLVDRYLGRCAEKLEMYDAARKHYTDGLNQGDKVCANYLGFMNYAGYLVEPNLEYAKRFFRIGQEAEDVDQANYAKMMLARIDMDSGTPKEKYEAFVYLRENVKTDDINLILGKAFSEGIPGYLERNDDEALRHFDAVAESDRGEAFFCMAFIYLGRRDTEKFERYMLSAAHLGYDPARYAVMENDRLTLMHVRESVDELVKAYNDKYDKASIEVVKRAAETDPVAMYEIASRYRMGQDGVEKDPDKSAAWYRKVLWHQRHVRALHFLGLYHDQSREDFDLARQYWEIAYSYGDVDSAVNLGIYYEYGTDNVKCDLEKAMQLFRFAKTHGRKDADSFIGRIHQKKGEYEQAERRFRSALMADPDNSYFYADMGFFYMDEKNPKYNEAEAIRWFREAAKRGNKEAQDILNDIESAKEAGNNDQSVPTAEQFLARNRELEANFKDTVGERYALLTQAEELYPNHPEILRAAINSFNLCNYLLKCSKDAERYRDRCYNGFRKVLEMVERLVKIRGMDPDLRRERSFAASHLADVALHMDQREYAWSVLEKADRMTAPFASVVALRYLLGRCSEIEDNSALSPGEKRRHMASYLKLAKKEVDALVKTVDQASLWNNQETERALGYYSLYLCYMSRDFEPYIRFDAAGAKMYLDKCAELNPQMAMGG